MGGMTWFTNLFIMWLRPFVQISVYSDGNHKTALYSAVAN